MKRISELTKPELAELEASQLQPLVDLELMAEGILRPDKPVPPPILEAKAPLTEYWSYQILATDRYSSPDPNPVVVFHTPEDARKFLELRPAFVKSEWSMGNVPYVQDVPEGGIGLMSRSYPSKDAVRSLAHVIKGNEEQKAAWEKADAEYAAALADVNKVEHEVGVLWQEALVKRQYMRKILDTYSQYLGMVGEHKELAETFLLKAFPQEDIDIAFTEWARPGDQVPPHYSTVVTATVE